MTAEVLNRSWWTNRQPTGRTAVNKADVYAITAHYIGTTGMNPRSDAECIRILQQIAAHDMGDKGYSDIMYSLAVLPHRPAVVILRGLDNRNAANGSTASNKAGPSVLFFKGPGSPALTEHETAGAQLADELCQLTYGKPLGWLSHSRWRPTSCCGPQVSAGLAQFDGRELILPPSFDPWATKPQDRPTLRRGDDDEHSIAPYVPAGDGWVHYVQRVVNASGQPLGVDGIYGRDTEASVWSFQIQHDVPTSWGAAPGALVDPAGQVGLLTWLKIDEIARRLGVK